MNLEIIHIIFVKQAEKNEQEIQTTPVSGLLGPLCWVGVCRLRLVISSN